MAENKAIPYQTVTTLTGADGNELPLSQLTEEQINAFVKGEIAVGQTAVDGAQPLEQQLEQTRNAAGVKPFISEVD